MPSHRSDGTPPDVPEQFRDAYQRAYEQALGDPMIEAEREGAPRQVTETEYRTRPGWVFPVAVVAGAVVLVGCAYVLGRMVSGSGDEPVKPAAQSSPRAGSSTTGYPSQDPESTQSADPPRDAFTGKVAALPVGSAQADCTAEPGVDASGSPIRYAPDNMLDGQSATAWRCDGQAIGERITFVLPQGSEVAEVGLIPGYAKTDAESGADRYAENNRITRATWILADGTEVEQEISDDPTDRSLRTIRVPATSGDQVVLRIDEVAKGKRNTTMISEVRFAAPAG